MNTSYCLQILAVIFMLFGAVLSLIISFRTERLIPSYNYKINILFHRIISPIADNLKKLSTHLLSELEKNQYNNIKIDSVLHAKLKSLESSINTALNDNEKVGDLFDESPQKSKNRFFYFLVFLSIGIAIIFQVIVLFIEIKHNNP